MVRYDQNSRSLVKIPNSLGGSEYPCHFASPWTTWFLIRLDRKSTKSCTGSRSSLAVGNPYFGERTLERTVGVCVSCEQSLYARARAALRAVSYRTIVNNVLHSYLEFTQLMCLPTQVMMIWPQFHQWNVFHCTIYVQCMYIRCRNFSTIVWYPLFVIRYRYCIILRYIC